MAVHQPFPDDEYLAHAATYRAFKRGVAMSIAAAATTLILLAFFLL
ncbi:MAG: hypothetical protein AB7J30_02500 [Hyphomicrobium sp.]